ncbi:MAG: transposase [Candidatus Brocadiaceae bacterium]|nr:transposase [Candidatus Brocadiaceae bacterium]
MFYKQENHTLSQKSQEIYEKLIDYDSLLPQIKKEFDFSFIYNLIKSFYCLDNGRNSLDGQIALKAIFTQRLFGLSERGLERKVKYDIEIKHFLDIEIDDESFDFTTIWKFKNQLGAEKVDEIFNTILTQIKKKGIIKSFRRQAIDTIPIVAASALPSITSLIYHAIKLVCQEVNDKLLSQIFKETDLTEEKLLHFSKARPLFRVGDSEKIKIFQKAAKRGFKVLELVHENKIDSDNVKLLEEILKENVDHKKNDEHKLKHTPHAKKSLTDKDAGLGHKTKEDIIFGYKAGMSTVQEGIITAYEVTSMSHRDDEHLNPIIEKQEKNEVKADELDGDSAFGFIKNFADAEKKKVILHAPVRNFDPEKLSAYDFKYNVEANELTCINNITVNGKNSGALTFEFPLRLCRVCPKANECPLAPSKVVKLHEKYDVAKRAIERQRKDIEITKENKEKGIKNFNRLVIENVFAFLEKLGIKETPAYSLEMTKVHVGIVSTLSNMIKTVRKLKKIRQENIQVKESATQLKLVLPVLYSAT